MKTRITVIIDIVGKDANQLAGAADIAKTQAMALVETIDPEAGTEADVSVTVQELDA